MPPDPKVVAGASVGALFGGLFGHHFGLTVELAIIGGAVVGLLVNFARKVR